MLSATLYKATKLLHNATADIQTRELERCIVGNSQDKTIEIPETHDRLREYMKKREISLMRNVRLDIIEFLNYLIFSDMTDPSKLVACADYFKTRDSPEPGFLVFENKALFRWWLENLHRIQKLIAISAFLEGENLGSFDGIVNLECRDIPQSIVLVLMFIKSMKSCEKIEKQLLEEHAMCCDLCPEIVKMYCDERHIKERKM